MSCGPFSQRHWPGARSSGSTSWPKRLRCSAVTCVPAAELNARQALQHKHLVMEASAFERFNQPLPVVAGIVAAGGVYERLAERTRALTRLERLTHRSPDPLHPGLEGRDE